MLGFLFSAVMSWLSALRMASHALQEGRTGPEALRKAHRTMLNPAQLILTNILLNLANEETTTVVVSTVYHNIPSSACLREQVRASWRSLRQSCHFATQQGSQCQAFSGSLCCPHSSETISLHPYPSLCQ